MGREWILRTCAPDMTAHGGFVWPRRGRVTAPDWDPAPNCGNGLHGLLRGEGDADFLDHSSDAVWLVASVDASQVVDLGGQVKFPVAHVLYAGDRDGALAKMQGRYPDACVVYNTATAGNYGTATAGNRGTAKAGNRGTATAGNYGTIIVQYWDESARRYRMALGDVGIDGIEANVAYRWDAVAGALAPVEAND